MSFLISPIREVQFKGGLEVDRIICHSTRVTEEDLLLEDGQVVVHKHKKNYSFALILTWFEGASTGKATLKIPFPNDREILLKGMQNKILDDCQIKCVKVQ